MSINCWWEKGIISPTSSYFPQNVHLIILSPKEGSLREQFKNSSIRSFYFLLPLEDKAVITLIV